MVADERMLLGIMPSCRRRGRADERQRSVLVVARNVYACDLSLEVISVFLALIPSLPAEEQQPCILSLIGQWKSLLPSVLPIGKTAPTAGSHTRKPHRGEHIGRRFHFLLFFNFFYFASALLTCVHCMRHGIMEGGHDR